VGRGHLCFQIQQFAEELQTEIKNNGVEDEYGYKYDYGPETIEALKKCQRIIEQAGQLAHAVEWLYSGDYGEDSFLECFSEMQEKYKKSDGS
jgi:hypothetical protein